METATSLEVVQGNTPMICQCKGQALGLPQFELLAEYCWQMMTEFSETQ